MRTILIHLSLILISNNNNR